MAENGVQSVSTNNSSEAITKSMTDSQRISVSAALVVDAKEGHLLMCECPDSIDVKLYFLYRNCILQYLLYLTIIFHHFIVLLEKSSRNETWVICLEMLCLSIYLLRLTHLVLLTHWSVLRNDKKNIIVLTTILITILEIFISLLFEDYIRWTPVLRPLFIVNLSDNKQIRRSFRNIRNTLPDVLNVLILFFVSILMFSIIGLKLFEKQSLVVGKDITNEKYFSNFFDIIFDLYVLVTTANNPDIMMPAYNRNGWFAVYFVIFVVINLYLFMNIILAVIYNNYRKHMKREVTNILNLKRQNFLRAFNLLSENKDIAKNDMKNESETGISKETFEHFMNVILNADRSERKHSSTLVAIYWSLLEINQKIPKQNFFQLLDLFNFDIEILTKCGNKTIFEKLLKGLYGSTASKMVRRGVKSKYFRHIFDSLILLNAIIIAFNFDYISIEWTLLLLFTFEILVKVYTFGFVSFIRKFWNIFDSIVIGFALILCLIIELRSSLTQELEQYLDLLLVLRVLRLCKIITTINRFKVVVKTVLALIPSISTYLGLLFVVYYIYALIGMRIFSPLRDDTKNNCQTNPIHCCPKNQSFDGNYCTLNFNTFPNAMLLLFDLMVVNQWHVLARTQELVSGTKLTRLYFVSFNLICVIIVLNILTAFILEAFILEYIDLTQKQTNKTSLQLRLENLGLNCFNKREEPTLHSEYIHFDDVLDADHDFIQTNTSETQEVNNFCLSFDYSDLKIIIREKKSVESLLYKMFRNEITL